MNRTNLAVSVAITILALFVSVAPVFAQPSLTSLWPVEVGRSWEFNVRVEGPFDEVETGVIAQSVASQRALPSGVVASCFDVVTTGLGGSPLGPLPSLLLAVPGCAFDIGVLTEEGEAVGVWSDSLGDWAWWWTPADLVPGSTFRLPIRTEVSTDAFVNGEVRTINELVSTSAGSFTNAVIIDYVVELGETEIVDPGAGVIGTAFFETVGWVAFVPGVGPVASEETRAPATIDCPACPAEIFEPISTSMDLRGTTPVGTEHVTFGNIKARY